LAKEQVDKTTRRQLFPSSEGKHFGGGHFCHKKLQKSSNKKELICSKICSKPEKTHQILLGFLFSRFELVKKHLWALKGRHDIQHNDIQQNDT